MKLEVILHNALCGKSVFELSKGVRPWGTLMITSAGKYTVTFPETGETFTFHPNEVSYIPPNMPFIRRVVEPIDFHQFAFRIEQSDPFCDALFPGKLAIPQSQVPAILRSLTQAMHLPEGAELDCHCLERILFENYLFTRDQKQSPFSEDIQQVLSHMNEHLSEKIDMDKLAALVYLSRTGLIWKFRNQLGTTPQQYLIMLRIRQAKQLLLEEEDTIAQIAERCGYTNAYYFSNAFRSNTGMSPTEFRKKHLGTDG